MRSRPIHRLRRHVAALCAVAMFVGAMGCTSTRRIQLTTAAPPPPDSSAVIVGVTTTEGSEISFSEPAVLQPAAPGSVPHLTAWVPTQYQGKPADQKQQFRLDEIDTYRMYDVVTKTSIPKTIGLVLLVAPVLFGVLICASGGFFTPC